MSVQQYLRKASLIIGNDEGDTRGNEFFTELICLAIDASILRELLPKLAVRGDIGSIKRRG